MALRDHKPAFMASLSVLFFILFYFPIRLVEGMHIEGINVGLQHMRKVQFHPSEYMYLFSSDTDARFYNDGHKL